MGETYEAAGVSIAAGEEAVERIKEKVRSTFRPEVIGDIGGFGGLFAFAHHRYRQPVLVSSTDGVGTKALVAQATGRFDTIGIDLVAMCVDDLVCQGAEPLFFLDYIAVGRLDPDHIEQLVEGVAEGCRQAGCALIGGEMAEHPGAMEPGEFDLVGFAVGVAERDQLITGEHVARRRRRSSACRRRACGPTATRSPAGSCFDVAGRSLDDPAFEGATHSLADELLEPSVIYAPADRWRCSERVDVRAVAHITGGGLAGNLSRVLPAQRRRRRRRAARGSRRRIFGEIQQPRRRSATTRWPRCSTSASAWSWSSRPTTVAERSSVLAAQRPPRRTRSVESTPAPAESDSISADSALVVPADRAPGAMPAGRTAHPVRVLATREPGRPREEAQSDVGERCAGADLAGRAFDDHGAELTRAGREQGLAPLPLPSGAQGVWRSGNGCLEQGSLAQGIQGVASLRGAVAIVVWRSSGDQSLRQLTVGRSAPRARCMDEDRATLPGRFGHLHRFRDERLEHVELIRCADTCRRPRWPIWFDRRTSSRSPRGSRRSRFV